MVTNQLRVFNPRSPAQVKKLLASRGIILDSTAKSELLKYKEDGFVEVLLKHRELSKLENSYIKPFLELKTLPLVHCTYNQVTYSQTTDTWDGIKSGRLSCSSPNLQQIPARTENGKLLRKLFIAREGKTFVVADYSQIELRVMAHFSQDPVMIDAYRTGKDIHDETSKALGVDRFWGKTANFSIGYGCSKWKLAALLNTTPEEADKFINAYWKRFKVLRSWRERVIQEARQTNGIKTLYGRWIPIQGLRSPDFKERGGAEREAVSYLVQGSAADIIKLAMLECAKQGFMPLVTVHDELVFEVEDAVQAMEAIKEIMNTIYKLYIPLEVSIGTGQNWASAKS